MNTHHRRRLARAAFLAGGIAVAITVHPHRDKSRVVDAQNQKVGQDIESTDLTAGKRLVNDYLNRLKPLVEQYEATPNRSFSRKLSKKIENLAKGASIARQEVLAKLTPYERIAFMAYEAKESGRLGVTEERLSSLKFRDPTVRKKSTSFTYSTLAENGSTDDHGSLDCGFYGPYHAEVDCDSRTSHAECWCDTQVLGYGKAKCECKPGRPKNAVIAKPNEICSIPIRQYACDFGGAGVSGTDLGCKAECPGGRPVCRENECHINYWTQSSCHCEYPSLADGFMDNASLASYGIEDNIKMALMLVNEQLYRLSDQPQTVLGVMPSIGINYFYAFESGRLSPMVIKFYADRNMSRLYFTITSEMPLRTTSGLQFPVVFTEHADASDHSYSWNVRIMFDDNDVRQIHVAYEEIHRGRGAQSQETVESNDIVIRGGKAVGTYSFRSFEGHIDKREFTSTALDRVRPDSLRNIPSQF